MVTSYFFNVTCDFICEEKKTFEFISLTKNPSLTGQSLQVSTGILSLNQG